MPVAMPIDAARAHEEMIAYWASRRAGGRLPSRAAIDPGHIQRRLPTICLIDVCLTDIRGEPRDYRLRLAGTGLYDVYGGEITGRLIEEIFPASAALYWRGALDEVVQARGPRSGAHNLAWRGAPHLTVHWLRLPLAADGERVDMILGYDVVTGRFGQETGIRAA